MLEISRKLVFLLFLSLSFLFANSLKAQSFEEAEMLFEQTDYEEAKKMFHDLYYSNMDNDFYKYRLGLCYLFTQEEEEALRLIIQVTSLKDKQENLNRLFYLARVYHLDHNFKEAIVYYQSFLDTYKNNPDEYDRTLENEVVLPAIYGGSAQTVEDPINIEESISRLIEECEYGLIMSENPTRIAIENAGDVINSERAEYAPVINATGDQLFFTSKIEVEEGEYAERLFVSKQIKTNEWTKPKEIIITDDIYTDIAPLYMSPDNDFGLIYDSRSNNGDIFSIVKNNDKWEEGESFPKSINGKSWEPSASMFPSGDTLIFSSNRDGGYGGLDLYMSVKDKKGKWADPVNLGPEINTSFDEDAPFVVYDEPKMYFSSRGHKSVGGYDIFETSFKNGKWSEPENMKMPINTAYDDIYFTWTKDGRRAYFSSHRLGTRGATDIYYMDFNQISLNVYVLKSSSEGPKPIQDFDVSLKHMQTGKMIDQINKEKEKGLSVFLSKEHEMYMLRVSAPGYIPYVESMRFRRGGEFIAYQTKRVILKEEGQPVFEEKEILETKKEDKPNTIPVVSKTKKPKSGKSIILGGDTYYVGDILKPKVHFILNESKNITNYSKSQMDIVIGYMNENPSLKIQIVAHADRSGNSVYNKELSHQRELSVKDYFLEHNVDESRLKGTWKGDEEPIIDTIEPELRNRRVEFHVVEL